MTPSIETLGTKTEDSKPLSNTNAAKTTINVPSSNYEYRLPLVKEEDTNSSLNTIAIGQGSRETLNRDPSAADLANSEKRSPKIFPKFPKSDSLEYLDTKLFTNHVRSR